MNKQILGIGNAIVDILTKVDDNFLIENNLVKGSMKLISRSEFKNLEKNIKIEKIVAGGSVANTMAGIAYLKGKTSFIGKINSDKFGNLYKKSLEDINVNFSYIKKKRIFTNWSIYNSNYSRLRKNYVYLSRYFITSFYQRYRSQ